jgi:undecaprenyl-diphosphatase
MALDTTLFFFLNNFAGRTATLDGVIIFCATYVPYIVVGIWALYLHHTRRAWKDRLVPLVVAFVAAIIARVGVGSTIRYFFPRPRPFLTYHVHQLIFVHAPSFPSGHALFFWAFSTVVYLYSRKMGILCYVLTLLICMARVAAGIHYPSDMLAGAVLGIASGYLTYRYIRPFIEQSRVWKVVEVR